MTQATSASDSGLGFGLVFGLENRFSGPANQIQNSFNSLSNASDKLSDRISNSLDRVYQGMAQIGAGVALMLPAKSAVTAFMEFDSLQRGMYAAFNNNTKAANDEIAKLAEVAKLPGLDMKSSLQGSINLMSAGMSADLARRSLLGFGNALANIGKGASELQGINLALSQILGKGVVSAEEVNQVAERLPMIRQIMLKTFGTANTEVLQKMKLTSRQFIEGIVTELEKLPKVTGGIGTKLENLQDLFWKMKVAIGSALAPAVEFLADKVMGLFDAVERFANTSFGRVTIQAVGLLTTLAAGTLILRGLRMAFGGVFGMMGGFMPTLKNIAIGAIAIFKNLGWYIKNIGFVIRYAFATNPIGIALGVITIGITQMYRAWNSFTNFLEGKSGVLSGYAGVLQRIGGYLQGLAAIFSTVTSEGWSMSVAMEDALRRMGILDNVIALGTWIVRIREIFVGFGQAIGESFSAVKGIFADAWSVMKNILGPTVSVKLERLLSSVGTFRSIGFAIGAIFGIVFKSIAAVVGIVGILVSAVIKAVGIIFNAWNNMWYGIGYVVGIVIRTIANAIMLIPAMFTSLVNSITGMFSSAYDWGSNFVTNLWEGIKSKWDGMLEWIKQKWQMITGIFDGFIQVSGDIIKAPIQAVSDATLNTRYLDENLTYRAMAAAAPISAAAYSAQPQIIENRSETVKNIIVPVHIDSREMYRTHNDISEFEAARE